ncbi:siderophore ABC transporter substrate-binding protein [Paenirhodobacter sp.]|uniref:siderophore ABC transporter substrate-binding protein n=1 Tax=Paenirhodobacter sp. TaxID=1965326 RepID=UPI003B404A4E
MIKPFVFALTAVHLLSSAALADIAVTHAQGETVLKAVPQTVMVTDWAAFDDLTSLGVPVAGVPGSAPPGYLAAKVTDDMTRIGSLQEPDVEAIAAAGPDLVIIGARSRKSYATLSQLVPVIDVSVDNGAVIDGAKANLTMLGKVFGREEQAETLKASLDAKVAQAKAAAAGKGTALVIVTNGGKIGVYGPKSRVSWLYNTLDVPSVFDTVDDRDHGGDAITFEYLLKTNPDWLFVVDRDAGVGTGGASAQKLLDNDLIHQTNFWKNDRVVYLDPAASYVTMNGYGALMLLLDQVTDAFSTK